MSEFKVLIVDDEPANVELLLEVFDMLDDCTVAKTHSPVEAIKMYQNDDYSLVLLDITMPEMSGYEVLERFSEIDKSTRPVVYVLTGHHDAAVKRKVMELGAEGLLTKPFEISAVISLVDKLKG